MRFKRPSISNLRLQRLHRWALLWLTWFVAQIDKAVAHAVLTQDLRAAAHRWLDTIDRVIVGIVVIQAAQRIRRRPQRMRRFSEYINARPTMRTILGARLRRDLRPKDLHARIVALRQDIDVLVAKLLRRLPCGLTRRAIVTRPEAHAFQIARIDGVPAPWFNTS
ncbi:MAG TPA: hypothetical protein VHC73_01635 [Vitreimonas sp.]|nr:hypothetical protein [Vitreimonas sp.]